MNGSAPTLWNPSAAANWSLIFTPAFGSDYARRPWGKALLIGVAALVGYVAVAVLAGAVFALVS